MSRSDHLTAADGHRLEIARADPPGKAKGGVIVLHAIYGLTSHIRHVCDLWAEAGYAAIAPAHFDRIAPGRVFDYTPAGSDAGRDCYAATSEANVMAEIAACRDALAECGPVVVSGFCTGGSFAWVAAAELDGIAAQVNFYGSHIASRHLDLHPACPTIIHYGDRDHVVPVADIERIRAANPAIELYVYPGAGHAFFNPEQAHYDTAAAKLAWQRSLAFLARALAGSS
jgi:carboxymethylenebutenolidase